MDSKNKKEEILREPENQKPLTGANFKGMAVAALLIVVGFILMLGGATTETEFNPEIFSTRRIVVGPALAFIGFVAMGVAIIYRPRKKDK